MKKEYFDCAYRKLTIGDKVAFYHNRYKREGLVMGTVKEFKGNSTIILTYKDGLGFSKNKDVLSKHICKLWYK